MSWLSSKSVSTNPRCSIGTVPGFKLGLNFAQWPSNWGRFRLELTNCCVCDQPTLQRLIKNHTTMMGCFQSLFQVMQKSWLTFRCHRCKIHLIRGGNICSRNLEFSISDQVRIVVLN